MMPWPSEAQLRHLRTAVRMERKAVCEVPSTVRGSMSDSAAVLPVRLAGEKGHPHSFLLILGGSLCA